MNIVTIIGNLTKDIEIKTTEKGTAIGRTSIAVRRDYKNAEGNYDADFINLVLFGNQATFANQYAGKGSKVAVSGRIQTSTYDKQDGTKGYSTDVIVNNIEVLTRKQPVETAVQPMGNAQTAVPVQNYAQAPYQPTQTVPTQPQNTTSGFQGTFVDSFDNTPYDKLPWED